MVQFAAALSILFSSHAVATKPTREDRAGWIYVKLSGEPHEIGYEYGTLLYKEIDEAHEVLHAALERSTGKTWAQLREIAHQTFWPHVEKQYRDEMQGQADALSAKGLTYNVFDVLTFNSYIELTDYYLPWRDKANRSFAPEACSASVAVGSATADGKVVMAHNFWWDYLTGQRFRVMLDIQPKSGHRVMFDALPGFIHSGTDFGINDAGIMISETTISGFSGFDPNGIPEFVRMRKALQYGTDLNEVAMIFKEGNNGGYANTWLLADTKRNEIGKLQLGLKNVIFDHKSDGAYYGANFPEDPKLIAEECKGYWQNPNNNCEVRKRRWDTLYSQNLGKVDATLAKQFLADSTLDNRSPYGSGTCNSKVATTAMVQNWQIWSRMGFSNGQAMSMERARANQPKIHDIAAQPWVLLGQK